MTHVYDVALLLSERPVFHKLPIYKEAVMGQKRDLKGCLITKSLLQSERVHRN